MTQISLKLFNKLPFMRNEMGGFRGRGVPRGGGPSSGLKIRRPRAWRAAGSDDESPRPGSA
jgi:hypothetical protein